MTLAKQSLHRALGLTDEEEERIQATLGRAPNHAELAMYAAMWSEHCSYKSSKVHLRTLPTAGPHILVGPGEDAGVVDLGDGLACVFKMESHSHPSAIEPVQGAATGVGGIVRDVLSMGARPVALLDPLRFGPLEESRNRWLMSGVVAGIGQYGNSIGVPTVGGEVKFAPAHGPNPTVNVMCVGFAPGDRLVRARAEGQGNILVLVGAATGRDGIGGVSVLASRTLEAGSDDARPSVQIGDPFVEKLLIEACLELVEAGLLVGLQDLGGAGLTCAVSESAARAGTGADIDLDAVPLREPRMEAFEILTSESQERMLAVVRPEDLDAVRAVCAKWGLASSTIGRVTGDGKVRAKVDGRVVTEVPARSLADDGPEYRRRMEPPAWLDDLAEDDPTFADPPVDPGQAFLRLLGSPNVASKGWVWEQYDSLVQGNTLVGPGGADAAVIRIEGTLKAVALATDGNGRYGRLDPYLGAAHAVAEGARNVACVGARPLAITNCLNFGNPERPDVMWAFAEAVRGMGEACRQLGTPVTGGNVSFYNESGDSAIWPTPVVGMLGVLDDYRLLVRPGFAPGFLVYLLGETFAELGGTEYSEVTLGKVSGRVPGLDLEREAGLISLLQEASRRDLVASAHDCSDGGLAVTLAECALAGDTGFAVGLPGDLPAHVALFSESASRVVVSVSPEKAGAFEALVAEHRVPFGRLGETGGPRMVFGDAFELTVAEAREVHQGALPRLLRGERAGG
ncbi:MAG TPA: phosphoribosylformylglycinamidine synthase subunit PurL [Actinomycetota bacterium]|nr:phosphoribosylformylglycinamidine synthase subunit PurL [Actinomycetota bacterium]